MQFLGLGSSLSIGRLLVYSIPLSLAVRRLSRSEEYRSFLPYVDILINGVDYYCSFYGPRRRPISPPMSTLAKTRRYDL